MTTSVDYATDRSGVRPRWIGHGRSLFSFRLLSLFEIFPPQVRFGSGRVDSIRFLTLLALCSYEMGSFFSHRPSTSGELTGVCLDADVPAYGFGFFVGIWHGYGGAGWSHQSVSVGVIHHVKISGLAFWCLIMLFALYFGRGHF